MFMFKNLGLGVKLLIVVLNALFWDDFRYSSMCIV